MKEDLFKAGAVKTEDFEYNGYTTKLRGLTLGEKTKFLKMAKKDEDKAEAYLVCLACEELTEEDINEVSKLSTEMTDKIVSRVTILSGMGSEEKKD